MIQPYIAEMVGMSPQSLQRRLSLSGTSYDTLVQETRFHIARAMLADTSEMIRDVAMMSGYGNPSIFRALFAE